MSKTNLQGLYSLLTYVTKHSAEHILIILNFELNKPDKKVQFNNFYNMKFPIHYLDPKCIFHAEEKSLDYVRWIFNFVPKKIKI
ncbi:MAG: hypothetical protein HRU35_04410 [Rickettsiaceae bacterium]|nr:hypothetical protein [Rickettsiaceae bacterium]